MPPRISICVPTYEPDPSHLRAALDSVLTQSFRDWEVLIHDDCSTRDVRGIVEMYLKDPRVRFVRSPRRLGIGGNWNACLTLTRAPLLQYLFQDDMWEPQYLERAEALLEQESRIGIVASHHSYYFEGPIDPLRAAGYRDLESERSATFRPGKADGRKFLREWIRRGLRPNLIGEPSFVLMRRPVVDAVGPFREDMPQGLDVEYWLRCLVHDDLGWIAEKGGAFRVHGKAASAQNEMQGHGLFDRVGYFDTLLRVLPPGETRTLTKQSLVEQFSKMIGKFVRRRREGGKVGVRGGGTSVLVGAVRRHPLLVLRGGLRFLLTRETE